MESVEALENVKEEIKTSVISSSKSNISVIHFRHVQKTFSMYFLPKTFFCRINLFLNEIVIIL